MAVDMFLKIDGIDGESQDEAHASEIDVLAWSWGLVQSGTTHLGGGSGAGKVNVQDLSFTHYIDSASAALMQHCMSGKHIGEAVLSVRKAGDGQQDYLIITMTDLIITSVSTGGSGGEDRITENISLNFAEVNVVYKPQDNSGALGADLVAGWNMAKNVATV